MASAKALGISQSEYQDAVNLEKLYNVVNKGNDSCGQCRSSGVRYVDTNSYKFLCQSCGTGKHGCKRIGDDRFKDSEIEKIEKKYGGGGGGGSSSKSKSSKHGSSSKEHEDSRVGKSHSDRTRSRKGKSKRRRESTSMSEESEDSVDNRKQRKSSRQRSWADDSFGDPFGDSAGIQKPKQPMADPWSSSGAGGWNQQPPHMQSNQPPHMQSQPPHMQSQPPHMQSQPPHMQSQYPQPQSWQQPTSHSYDDNYGGYGGFPPGRPTPPHNMQSQYGMQYPQHGPSGGMMPPQSLKPTGYGQSMHSISQYTTGQQAPSPHYPLPQQRISGVDQMRRSTNPFSRGVGAGMRAQGVNPFGGVQRSTPPSTRPMPSVNQRSPNYQGYPQQNYNMYGSTPTNPHQPSMSQTGMQQYPRQQQQNMYNSQQQGRPPSFNQASGYGGRQGTEAYQPHDMGRPWRWTTGTVGGPSPPGNDEWWKS